MTEQQNTKKSKPLVNKIIKLFWGSIGLGIISVVLLVLLTSWEVFGPLPDFEELENPDIAVATEVYSADGEILGKIYRKNRVTVTFDEFPPHLVDALLATEDIRFYKHAGIDLKSTIRAFAFLGKRGGGSTLTQQFAKNILHDRKSNLLKRGIQKVKEYIVAVRLERSYTKEEILAMYLNEVDFSHNAIGIKTAAKVYFNKDVKDLTIEEASVFAGMLKSPYYKNPKSFPEDSTIRRNSTINQMAKYNKISKAARDSIKQIPIKLDFNKDDHNTGLAPYLRSVIQNDKLKQWIEENPRLDGEKYDMYRDGLKIYTTIDSRMQAIAEKSVQSHLIELQKDFDKQNKRTDIWKDKRAQTALQIAISNNERYQNRRRKGMEREKIIEEMSKELEMTVYHPLKGEVDTVMSPIDSIKYHRTMLQSGFVAMDPHTGHVKAWVGGRDFQYFKLDHATTKRQVGSTFKPFLYTVAIDNGWTPCFTVPNYPVSIQTKTGDIWTPKNSDSDEYDGRPITLKEGLARSKNTISAFLIKEIGPEPVKELTTRLGLKDIPSVYSIALGTTEQSVVDMAQAYTAYANSGVSTEPIVITRIEDKNGNVLGEFVPSKVEAMSKELAYTMVEMMRGVVTGGTAGRLSWKYGIKNYVVGKTGTTDDHSDGWFVGLTPDLIGVVWTGCDDPVLRFRSIAKGSGTNMALPIWGQFFRDVYEEEDTFGIKKAAYFEKPSYLSVEMQCEELPEMITVTDSTTVTPSVPVPNSNTSTTTTGGVLQPDDEDDDFQ